MTQLSLKNSPVYRGSIHFLQNGVNRNYINELIKPFQVPFPEELYTLCEWKNGIANAGLKEEGQEASNLFTLHFPMSIENSIEAYKYYSFEYSYWDKRYFPFLKAD